MVYSLDVSPCQSESLYRTPLPRHPHSPVEDQGGLLTSIWALFAVPPGPGKASPSYYCLRRHICRAAAGPGGVTAAEAEVSQPGPGTAL